MGQATDQEIKEALERKGHYALNWEDLDKIELPTGVISSMYRVGDPTQAESPTVFKVFYPPGCTIEAHTHDCDYTEIILEGSQRVGATWHHAGDIRIGLANRGYGPLVAGPRAQRYYLCLPTGRGPRSNWATTMAQPSAVKSSRRTLKRCRRARTASQRKGNHSWRIVAG